MLNWKCYHSRIYSRNKKLQHREIEQSVFVFINSQNIYLARLRRERSILSPRWEKLYSNQQSNVT